MWAFKDPSTNYAPQSSNWTLYYCPDLQEGLSPVICCMHDILDFLSVVQHSWHIMPNILLTFSWILPGQRGPSGHTGSPGAWPSRVVILLCHPCIISWQESTPIPWTPMVLHISLPPLYPSGRSPHLQSILNMVGDSSLPCVTPIYPLNGDF